MIPTEKIAHLVIRHDPALVQLIEGKLIEAYGFDVTSAWTKPRASGIGDCELALVFKALLPEGTVIRKHLRNFLSTRMGTFIHELIQNANWGDEAIAEDEIDREFMRGHSDLFMKQAGIEPDLKTVFADDFVDVAANCRPQKNSHVVQANWYAVMHGCKRVALVYINRNLKLTDHLRRSQAWQTYLRQYPGASETMVAIAFDADPRLAAAANRKAKRIIEHVAAGTLPEYDPLPEMLVPYKGECHFCEVRQLCLEARERKAAPKSSAPVEDPAPYEIPQVVTWHNLTQENGKTTRLFWQNWKSKVVGTTHHDAIPWDRLQSGDRLDLEWDQQNPDGPRFLEKFAQAIQVIHRPTAAILGHLPSTKSATAGKVCWHLYHLGLLDGRNGEAFALITEITGGTEDKANRGINLEVTLCAADGLVPPDGLPPPPSA